MIFVPKQLVSVLFMTVFLCGVFGTVIFGLSAPVFAVETPGFPVLNERMSAKTGRVIRAKPYVEAHAPVRLNWRGAKESEKIIKGTDATTQTLLPPEDVREDYPLITPVPVSDLSLPASSDEMPVDLIADKLVHDDEGQTVSAMGNVELVQGGRILRADKIIYNLATDTVEAHGNIALNEPNGDVHFADHVTLSDNMRSGVVVGLRSYLAEGGRFTAQEGTRQDGGTKIVMRDASYTPCNCENDKDGNPAWQIKAKEVTYDEEEHNISYRHARFEIFGVPVAYTPYFVHSDGTEKRKSGFLMPIVGFDSQLGTTLTSNYYWDMAPNRDATLGVMATSREAPVALGEYRHRFSDASIKLAGSLTHSGRIDDIAGEDVEQEEDIRGHLFADARWDINNKWRAGAELELASDDQYLRQYDFTGKDVLENELYLERFSGRNYAVGRLLSFQDVRVREERSDQPNVLPEIDIGFIGEPNALLGGRWDVDLSALALQRDGSGQDVNRGTAEAGWEGRYVTDFGLVNTLDLSVRGDVYHVTDRDVAEAGSGRSRNASQTRWFSQAHLVSSYPLVKPYEKMDAVITPVVSVTLASNIDSDDNDIPNEDSQDVQLDASNLFEANRFPGMDLIEDRSRATYGLRAGLYGHKGSRLEVFAGQSRRLDEDDNPFPEGSGLSRQESDIVGQISTSYAGDMGLDYRFQVDSVDLLSQRHELDAFAHLGPVTLNSRYLFAKALEGTDIDESREQFLGSGSLDVTDHWRIRSGALYDLGADSGLRKAMLGLDYLGCCMSFSVAAERNLTSDSSGDSGTDIMFRIGLKHIGEFETSNSGGWSAGNIPR